MILFEKVHFPLELLSIGTTKLFVGIQKGYRPIKSKSKVFFLMLKEVF